MPCSAPEDLLVIGYGNRLRGDDGAGPAAAETLRLAGMQAIACHQLLPELAETISHYRRLVLIDACADAAPGSVRWQEAAAFSEAGGIRAHEFDPGALLAMAALLYGSTPRTLLVTIGGLTWDEPDRLSPPVQAAVAMVCRALPRRLIRMDAAAAMERAVHA